MHPEGFVPSGPVLLYARGNLFLMSDVQNRTAAERHLGVLGPVIRGEVGDILR